VFLLEAKRKERVVDLVILLQKTARMFVARSKVTQLFKIRMLYFVASPFLFNSYIL